MLRSMKLTRCPECGEYFIGLEEGEVCPYCEEVKVVEVDSFSSEVDMKKCLECGSSSIKEVAFDIGLELLIGERLAALNLTGIEGYCIKCNDWIMTNSTTTISATVFWDSKVQKGKVFVYDDRYHKLMPAEKARIIAVESEEKGGILSLEEWRWRINDSPFGEDNAPRLEELEDYILIINPEEQRIVHIGSYVPKNWELFFL